MRLHHIFTMMLCLCVAVGAQAQNKKPQKPTKKPTTQKPANVQVPPVTNVESIISMTDTAAYAGIKHLDEQIKKTDQQIAKLKASQQKPSAELSLASREEVLLKNDTELYQLYSEREKLVLRKKELRRKTLNQTLQQAGK